jgi:hypothetical protein
MPFLVVPNVIADGIAADGSDLGANFSSISNWANGNVGNDNYSGQPADRLSLTKYANYRHLTSHMVSADSVTQGGTNYLQHANFSAVPAKDQKLRSIVAHANGSLVQLSLATGPVSGTWHIWVNIGGVVSLGPTTLVSGTAGAGGAMAHNVSTSTAAFAAGDVIDVWIRQDSGAGGDKVERHAIELIVKYDHQAV